MEFRQAARFSALELSAEGPPRLGRDTTKTLELVVLLLRGQKVGLRPEQLRQRFGLPKAEMTPVPKQGLATKNNQRATAGGDVFRRDGIGRARGRRVG